VRTGDESYAAGQYLRNLGHTDWTLRHRHNASEDLRAAAGSEPVSSIRNMPSDRIEPGERQGLWQPKHISPRGLPWPWAARVPQAGKPGRGKGANLTRPVEGAALGFRGRPRHPNLPAAGTHCAFSAKFLRLGTI
jgi:hypothetical protein